MSESNATKKTFGIEVVFLQLLLLPAGVLLLFIVILFLVVFPRVETIQDTNNKTDNTNKMTETVKEKVEYLSGIDPVDLKQNAERLNSAIFAEKNSYFLINIIRIIADQFEFQIQDFSLSPGEVKQEELVTKTVVDAVTRIPIDIVLVGPKVKYLDFVEALEKSLPILSMDSFKLVTAQESIKLTLTLTAYYVPTKNTLDISKLTLADLTLSKEESGLINKLIDFNRASTGSIGIGESSSQRFIKYSRPNPFSF